jgi:hypothetical protein
MPSKQFRISIGKMAPASRTRAVDLDEVIVIDLQLLAKMVHPFISY